MDGVSWFTPAPVGNGSMTVNGGLFPVPMSNAFYPNLASAPMYKGSGQPPPTVPLSYMQGSGSMAQDQTTKAAMSSPFSFTQSPLIMAVLALAIGLLGLRYVHWRG
jgi:hypothetical protein